MAGVLWGWGEGHGELLVVQGEEHLDQLLLEEDEGEIQLGVLHEDLEDHLVETQVAVHLEGGVQDLDIQGMALVQGDLWVELVAWILVASHWECWAWSQEFLVCHLPCASGKELSANWS